MHAQELEQDAAEIKPFPQVDHRPWYSICREMWDHPVVGAHVTIPKAADPKRPALPYYMMWEWMIAEAAFFDRKRVIKGHPIFLRRGQLAASQSYISERANWSRKAVRVFLGRLERFKMITVQNGSPAEQLVLAFPELAGGVAKWGQPLSVLTICNYGKYQNEKSAKGQPGANQGPTRGQPGARTNTKDTKDTKEQEDSHSGTRTSGREYWQQQLNPGLGDIQYVDGQLTLEGATHARWLKEFDDDERRLRLALIELHIEPNSTVAIAVQVERKLARIVRDALERDKRAEKSVRAGRTATKKLTVDQKVESANKFMARAMGKAGV